MLSHYAPREKKTDAKSSSSHWTHTHWCTLFQIQVYDDIMTAPATSRPQNRGEVGYMGL